MQHARILIVCRGITLDSLRVLCDLLSNLAGGQVGQQVGSTRDT